MSRKIVRLPDGYYIFHWEWGSWSSDGPYKYWLRAWFARLWT